MPDAPSTDDGPWWRTGVLYQVYPRSFADSDGDGVGDLPGIVDRLDYLQWLGVDGLWLGPINVSPHADWGYDVADYLAVDPELGTLSDLDRLIAEAGRRGIRVLLDLVPSHTSDQHPWFVDSRSSRAARHRNWYVWADPRPDGSPPNNWVSSFGGSAWTLDGATGQYYLHNHLVEQPDLNWWDGEVRRAFDDIIAFWLDRGVAGFRIDVCHGMIKDALLRDNPPAEESDPPDVRLFGQRPVYNSDRPEVHEVLRRWRRLADRYPGRVLLGETPVPTADSLAAYYGDGSDELHLAFNFAFLESPLEAGAMRTVVKATEEALPADGWPVWTGSNHDLGRFATRWAGGRPEQARVALVILLCLRGTPVLYQGDELGLCDTDVPPERMADPLGVRYWPAYAGRDGARTPMPWRDGPGGGFTRPGVEPWLPFGDLSACNVEAERGDPDSMLHLTHDLLALRRAEPDLTSGRYRSLEAPPGAWAWSRGDRLTVLAAMTSDGATLDGVTGTVVAATDRRRRGEAVDGVVRVGGWEAVVVAPPASKVPG
ncbi:MAG: alpha-amylase family glycosyl hydrolase [Acidimicrobiales bacterium]